MKKILAVLFAFAFPFLAGCAGGPQLADNVHTRSTLKHSTMLDAQVEIRKPEYRKVFELKGWEGEDIVMSGVRSLTIYSEPDDGGIKAYVSPGYALARDLTQMLVFPLTGLAMFSEAVRSASTAFEPNYAPSVDPFVPRTELPFVPPVAQ